VIENENYVLTMLMIYLDLYFYNQSVVFTNFRYNKIIKLPGTTMSFFHDSTIYTQHNELYLTPPHPRISRECFRCVYVLSDAFRRLKHSICSLSSILYANFLYLVVVIVTLLLHLLNNNMRVPIQSINETN
jgi:hypothetical protein